MDLGSSLHHFRDPKAPPQAFSSHFDFEICKSPPFWGPGLLTSAQRRVMYPGIKPGEILLGRVPFPYQ